MEQFDGILLDDDSYFNYLKTTTAQETLMSAKQWIIRDDHQELAGMLYLVLRSVMTIGTGATEETLKHQQEWRKICARRAELLTMLPEFCENPPLPSWAAGSVEHVRQQLRSDFPQVDEITVSATLDPRLYVRSYHPDRQIRISLLFRELLRTVNLAVWNIVILSLDNASWREVRDEPLPDECFLPYLLPLYWDIPWSRVPSLRAYSQGAGWGATTCARLQMTFMIAHEFAHLLLHDGGARGSELEIEADKFAYDVLFRTPGENITVGDVWMSTRWLFEILTLERTISWRLSGNDGMPEVIGPRREQLLFPFARTAGPSMVDVNLGGRGLKLLSNTRAALADLTAAVLRQRAQRWFTVMTGAADEESYRIVDTIRED
jgi:hypothetical protein